LPWFIVACGNVRVVPVNGQLLLRGPLGRRQSAVTSVAGRLRATFASDWRRRRRPVVLELRHRSLSSQPPAPSKLQPSKFVENGPIVDALQHSGAIHSVQCPTPRGHSQSDSSDAHSEHEKEHQGATFCPPVVGRERQAGR